MIEKLTDKLNREYESYKIKKQKENFDFDEFESYDYDLTKVQSIIYNFDKFKYTLKKTFTKQNIESSLVKTLTYPVLGALPSELRDKLKDNALVKKYDMDLETAASTSDTIERCAIAFGIPLVTSIWTFPLSCLGAIFYSSYRSEIEEEKGGPLKGSLLTEIPYKIYKNIKKLIDYIEH